MIHNCRRLAAVLFAMAAVLLAIAAGGSVVPAAHAQDEPDTRARTEVVGSLKCHIIRPIDADGNELPPAGLLLGLAGRAVEADDFNRELARHLARPGEIVVTPELVLDGSDRDTAGAFRPAGDSTDEELAAGRAVATLLARNALRYLKTEHGIRRTETFPFRVVGFSDGVGTTLDLIEKDPKLADELVLVSPDFDTLPPRWPVSMGRQSRPLGELLPPTDVMLDLTGGMRDTLRERAQTLFPFARIHEARRGARSIGEYLQEVAAATERPVIVDTANGNQRLDFAAFTRQLAEHRVVVFGETHDNLAGHRLEAAIYEKLLEYGDERRALSMEMFERDVQRAVDLYLVDDIDEAEFLSRSRPWPNYRSGYRAMIELAKTWSARVIAANVPRRYAAMVARASGDEDPLAGLSEDERSWVARETSAEPGRYRNRFFEAMGLNTDDAGNAHGMNVEAMFAAQCLKDDTMAEAICDYLADNDRGTVFHVCGQFHSDFRLGTVARIVSRMPNADVAVISAIPVANPKLATIEADAPAGVARYVVFVPRSHPR